MTNAPGSLLTQEALNKIVMGGYCFAPAGVSILDGCKDSSAFQTQNLSQYLPRDVTLEHNVVLASSGGGYIYHVHWNYSPPAAIAEAEAGIQWQLLEDTTGNPNPDVTDWRTFVSSLRQPRYSNDGPKDYITDKLDPGRKYVYYMTAGQFGGNAESRLLVAALVVFYRVTIDLTQAVPHAE